MKRIIGVAAAALCAASFAAYADSAEHAEKKADKAQVEADYKAAWMGAYNYFQTWVQRFDVDFEVVSTEVLHLMTGEKELVR